MLTADGVSKTYEPPTGLAGLLVRTASSEPIQAVRDITFSVGRGEILGLVGPNGAGKSTLLRMCAGLLTPTSGRVTVDGRDVATDPADVRRITGLLLADDRALYWRLTGRQNLRFFGVMAGLSAAEARRRSELLMEEFGLADRDRRVFGYSSGMRVRLGLARTLIADPELVILDEPTRSLDPAASSDLLRRVRHLRESGRAVVLSTHRLTEVEAVCDRVVVLDQGAALLAAAVADLAADGSPPTEVLTRLLGAELDP
ncbi:ABC transporter ATP-binding protein [Euzebya tangerina]|uniref:ABC transporter ATP-binding protein n=1 Tax=Euzebya tangerina TaxID=591198 RepID=UPI000E31A2BA|nr:ABC transporter ATP-binding protein [Euzebya tangerina]